MKGKTAASPECVRDKMGLQKEKLEVRLSQLESAIIRVILYFDVFSYPLKEEEIFRNLGIAADSIEEVAEGLKRLVEIGCLSQSGDYFFLGKDESIIPRREAGNSLASKRMKQAYKNSRLISKFPYVEAVMLSGSISKGYMEEGADIDFFIITKPGRLWVSRTLLILYKKVFLLNSHKHFCVNYFIDSNHLEIEDKNIFTATETVSLFPTVNPEAYKAFRKANEWASGYFPNHHGRLSCNCMALKKPRLRRWGEWVLNGSLGTKIDAWCMRKTLKHWRKKFDQMEKERFDLALRSRKYVSKHHPSDFQNKVLNRIQAGLEEFEGRHKVKLSS